MPCAALSRGVRQTAPHTSPLAFDDTVQNNPCGYKAVTSVNGVNVAGENLCMFHWISAHGQAAYIAPIVKEP